MKTFILISIIVLAAAIFGAAVAVAAVVRKVDEIYRDRDFDDDV